MIEFWWAYLLLGAVVGLLAGMLGVGGGLIIVPILSFIYTAKGFPAQHIPHLALGTGLATVLFTSLSSTLSHHQRGAVRWDIVRAIAPGITLGTLSGSLVAGTMSARIITIIFTGVVYFLCLRLLFASPPVPSRPVPGKAISFGAGAVLGVIASFSAMGGAAFSVPFMVKRNVPMHHAIGTASAIGFPIALAGTIGFAIVGSRAQLPPYTLGFVYIPAVIGVVIATTFTAPLGAKIAHRTPAATLRKIFAVLLFVLATRMLLRFL